MQIAKVFSPLIILLCTPLVGETISLKEASSKALKESSLIKSAKLNVFGQEKIYEYSGWIHNPEFRIEAQNFFGTGDYRWFKSAEITYSLAQTFELGRKGEYRKDNARQNLELAQLSELDQKLDLIKDISIAHAYAVYCQERLIFALEQKDLAEDLYKEVLNRVSHAREPLIQENKASIALFSAQFDHEKAVRDLSLAKQALVNIWNAHQEDFLLDSEEFFHVEKPLMEQQMEEMLPNNPHLKISLARIALANTQLKLEKSLGVVDLTFNLGIKHHLDNHNVSLMLGFSLPLPFFNRNQGPTFKAELEIVKARVDAETEKMKMVLSLHEWLKNIENAYSNVLTLKNSIIPQAIKSFSLSREGYRSGKASYYEVLDSQRTLSEVKEHYLSALKEYHVANAEIERLIAKHIDHQFVTKGGKHEE